MTAPHPQLRWSGLTHPGRYRPNNEDTFLALAFDAEGLRFLGKTGTAERVQQDFLFAVSDGMGGANSGEFASRIAMDRIAQMIPPAFRRPSSTDASQYLTVLENLFKRIHADMVSYGRHYPECAGMGATLSLGWITPDALYLAHVGDSRIYHLPQAGALTQLTVDHTYVGWMRRQGTLTEPEARRHPQRNILQKVLGAGAQFMDPQLTSLSYSAGDRFLLCTDGVNDGMWDHDLALQMAAPDVELLTPALMEEALYRGGEDNLTALVVEIVPR